MFTKESEDVPEVTERFFGDDDQEMTDIVFTQDMLKSKINKLKEDKSPGDDLHLHLFDNKGGITPKFLKNVVDELAQD